jgi:hypothetical protein
MAWPHSHREKCTTVGCGISTWIQSVIRKWTKDKQNERVLRRTNNQALVARPIHEWRCACTTIEGTLIKSEVNFCLCSWSIKDDCI